MKAKIQLTIILFLTLQFGYIMANPIDKEIAKKVAISFMNSKVGSSIIVKNVIIEDLNGQISFYVVNFQAGGWVMVSADNSTVPVLSYSLYGEYKLEDEKPEAFIELTNSYKEQIISSENIKSTDTEYNSQWKRLIEENNRKLSHTYNPGTNLLNVPNRGQIEWRQSTNNSGTCTPSYNAFCPTNSDCNCDRFPAGCGSVAMGQIMWYWKWPLSSSYRTYNWDLMPPKLLHNEATAKADEVAQLLRDCGLASNMNYGIADLGCFSWTTSNNIKDAFKNTFKYEGVRRTLKSHWKDSDVWCDLMRSEIDNQRPVFYYGENLIDKRHYFILVGYDAEDPDYFLFNFGHGGQDYNITYHYLNDITPNSYNFSYLQRAIVGISPTYYYPEKENVFDVPYTIVSDIKSEEAQQDIVLPATDKELTIENGGELTLTAGNSITLNPGFSSKAGSKFTAQINPDYTNEMDISVETWYNAFTPNNPLCYNVKNANSWEFTAIDGNNKVVFQSAGSITGNNVCVWDGSGANALSASYRCIVRLKNNYGRYKENDYWVFYSTSTGQRKEESISLDSHTFGIDETKNQLTIIQNQVSEGLFTTYPNPSDGIVNLKFSDNSEKNITVYNSQGVLCYQASDIKRSEYKIDMNSHRTGLYIIFVEMGNQIFSKKIVIKS